MQEDYAPPPMNSQQTEILMAQVQDWSAQQSYGR